MEAALNLFFDALRISSKYGFDNTNDTPSSSTEWAITLERYRMAATNVPIDMTLLTHERRRLLDALSSRCANCWSEAEASLFLSHYANEELHDGTLLKSSGASNLKSSTMSGDYRTKSCYVQTQMQQIFPGLFLSSFHPAADAAILQNAGITHVLCCINVTPRFPRQFQYLTLAADDNATFDISVFFESAFLFIEGALGGGGSVLVHCGAGISRAPTILASYVMRKTGMRAKDVLTHMKKIRSCASPNRGFVQQLEALEKRLTSESK